MTTAQQHGMTKYIAVYVVLVVLAALQFLIGYKANGMQLVVRMLTFGAVEVILVLLFMMNLTSEVRRFIKFFAYIMLFVIASMNWIWTDSFRLLIYHLTGMAPS